MQAVKEKLQDMNTMRKIKAEAKAEEKRYRDAGSQPRTQAEKELANARKEIAHEVRLAKEAEATMDLHVSKAGEKAEREIAKHENPGAGGVGMNSGGVDMNSTEPVTMGGANYDPTYTAN